MAHIRVAGVDVLVSSKRSQTFCPAVFALHGIDIATKRCVGLKSVAHFRAGFTPGRKRYGVHLNPWASSYAPSSTSFIWRILSACPPSRTPWLRGPVSPRFTLGEGGNVSQIITADAMGLTTKRPGVFEHHRCTQPMWPNQVRLSESS